MIISRISINLTPIGKKFVNARCVHIVLKVGALCIPIFGVLYCDSLMILHHFLRLPPKKDPIFIKKFPVLAKKGLFSDFVREQRRNSPTQINLLNKLE